MSLNPEFSFLPACDDDECEPCPPREPRRSAIVERVLIEAAVVSVSLLLPKILKRLERWWRDATKPPAPPPKAPRKRAKP